MDTLHPSDASRNSRTPDDAPAADETLAAHARRALLARLRARVTAVLDAGIALQSTRLGPRDLAALREALATIDECTRVLQALRRPR